jgi:hypothetical protein
MISRNNLKQTTYIVADIPIRNLIIDINFVARNILNYVVY